MGGFRHTKSRFGRGFSPPRSDLGAPNLAPAAVALGYEKTEKIAQNRSLRDIFAVALGWENADFGGFSAFSKLEILRLKIATKTDHRF